MRFPLKQAISGRWLSDRLGLALLGEDRAIRAVCELLIREGEIKLPLKLAFADGPVSNHRTDDDDSADWWKSGFSRN